MDVSKIIAKSRIQTNTSEAQKSNILMLEDLNTIQDVIFSQLGSVNKLYAWTYWHTDTIAWQSEYRLPVVDIQNSTPWLKRVLKAYIDYWTGFEAVRLFTEPQEWMHWPIARQADNSLFFEPAPTQSIVWGIRVEWTYRPMPLLLSSTSDSIKLSAEYHDVYLMWLNKMNYEDKQLFNEAQLWENKFIVKMREIMQQWAMDIDWPYYERDNTFLLG